MNPVRYLIIPLALATASPVHANSGVQTTAGTDKEVHAGVALDLAGRKPGDDRTADAQMHLGLVVNPGDGGRVGGMAGFGIEKRFGGYGMGVTADGYLLFQTDVDPHLGEASPAIDIRLGAYGLAPLSGRLKLVGEADYSMAREDVNARLGVRMDFDRGKK